MNGAGYFNALYQGKPVAVFTPFSSYRWTSGHLSINAPADRDLTNPLDLLGEVGIGDCSPERSEVRSRPNVARPDLGKHQPICSLRRSIASAPDWPTLTAALHGLIMPRAIVPRVRNRSARAPTAAPILR